MIDATARFQVCPDVVSRDIEGGLLLVDLRNGATWKLNQLGAAVCRQIDAGADLAALLGDLQGRYDVGADRLRGDVEALLAELQQQGLVQPAKPATPVR